MKLYCQNCGKPAHYQGADKPNFCSSCGSSFSPPGDSPKAQQHMARQTLGEHEDVMASSNDEEDVTFVPNLQKLDISIDVEKPARGVRLEDLVGTAELNSNPDEPRMVDPATQSQEDFLKDFQKEAGSLRGKSTGDGKKES